MNDFIQNAYGMEVLTDAMPQAQNQFTVNESGEHMLNFHNINHKHLKVAFTTVSGIKHIVKGRVAQTICWLCEKQLYGITAFEMSSWALRLSAYIHILRKKYGITIHTVDEHHDGGTHARYVLVDLIQISEVMDLSK